MGAKTFFAHPIRIGPVISVFLINASIFFGSTTPAQAATTIIYVDASAAAGGDGTSWTTAYTTLHDALADDANRTFTAAYQAQTGRTADVFALLGYDSIRMLAQAIESVGGDVRQVHRLSQRLNDMQLDSPRGTLRMNADTGTIESPLSLREVQQHGSTLQNQVLGELEPISELDEAVVAHRDAIVSGWLNPYLAV